MTYSPSCLVLLAALTHCLLEYIREIRRPSRHLVWLFLAGSALVYGPVVIGVLLVEQPQFSARHWMSLSATSVLHLLYSISLQTGYRHSDLFVVYPSRAARVRCCRSSAPPCC